MAYFDYLSAIVADMGTLTAGKIELGKWEGTPAKFTGIRIHKTNTTYQVAGINNDVLQGYIDSDGKIKAGGGNIILDVDGIKIRGQTLYIQDAGGVTKGWLYYDPGDDSLRIATAGGAGQYLALVSNTDVLINMPTTASHCLYPSGNIKHHLGKSGSNWLYAYIYGNRKAGTISAGGEWWWGVRGTETPLLWGGDGNYQYYKDFQIKLETDNAKIYNAGTAAQNVAAFRLSG